MTLVIAFALCLKMRILLLKKKKKSLPACPRKDLLLVLTVKGWKESLKLTEDLSLFPIFESLLVLISSRQKGVAWLTYNFILKNFSWKPDSNNRFLPFNKLDQILVSERELNESLSLSLSGSLSVSNLFSSSLHFLDILSHYQIISLIYYLPLFNLLTGIFNPPA